jgi:putative FmdB family regulatory protein
MPLYEYECDSCGHRFEVIQKFSDPLVDTCPKCGSKVHKLMSSPAIQFKGSGFYINDYAKKDSNAATKTASAKDGGTNEGNTKEGNTKEGGTKEGGTKEGGTKEGGTTSGTSAPSSSNSAAKPAAPAPSTKPE